MTAVTSSSPSQTNARHPLAELRAQRGLSREVLGSLAGVSPRTIQRIEIHDGRPQRATIRVLCEVLEAEPSEIFPGIWGMPGEPHTR
jgi:transcriptional regulator with XRE-family HTH domain